jgi:polyphosphate glucokinase
MKNLPAHVMLGANSNAIEGGIRLWQTAEERKLLVAPRKDAPVLLSDKKRGAGRR